MGEFFITMGLMVFPIFIGVLFMVIPGIVLSLAWTLAYYFLIEKGKNPIRGHQALRTTPPTAANGRCSPWHSYSASPLVIVLLIFNAICGMINVGFITFIVMFVL